MVFLEPTATLQMGASVMLIKGATMQKAAFSHLKNYTYFGKIH